MRELGDIIGKAGASGGGIEAVWQYGRDLLMLSKARVVALLVFTAIVGEMLAPDFWLHWQGGLAGILGIALAGGAGGVLNQLVEPVIDRHMKRTSLRPLVNGRVSRVAAMVYAAMLFSVAIIVLSTWTNPATLWLTLTGTVGYGIVYTLYLKPSTPWNIVWGGLAGALPPMIGWTAVGGQPWDVLPLSLVALIFFWTPAHFWPLSLYYREDYAKAHIPMLPVTHGVDRTRREIVRYSWLTLAASLVPVVVGDAGILYAVVAVVFGGHYLWMTRQLASMPVDRRMDQYARRIFVRSILYLFALYATLIGGHLWHLVIAHGF